MASWTIKQNDTLPIFDDTLTFLNEDGTTTPVDLTGATVLFVMRALSSSTVAVNAAGAVVGNPVLGAVQYIPQAADTATAGEYVASWIVTTSSGTQTFPTEGYNTVSVEPSALVAAQTIVELAEAKEFLNWQDADRTRDAELGRFLLGIVPVIEGIVGPVVPRSYTEMYDGGFWYISVRHRPIISVASVTEYRGSIAYPLTQVASPELGTTYSYIFETGGRITRRTNGGGMTTFPPGADAVTVTYTAGYTTIPQNIRLGTLELLRETYQDTQQSGRPQFGAVDAGQIYAAYQQQGSLVSDRVRSILAPSRRHPSVV